MKLSYKKAQAFLNLYKNLLEFIFSKKIGEKIETTNDYLTARNILSEDFGVIDEFILMAKKLDKNQLKILENIKIGIKDRFIYLKTLKKHSIMINTSSNKVYCVLGITDSIEKLVPGKYSIIETLIFNFDNHIICDGLIAPLNIILGQNMRKDMNALYKKIKNNNELVKYIPNY